MYQELPFKFKLYLDEIPLVLLELNESALIYIQKD